MTTVRNTIALALLVLVCLVLLAPALGAWLVNIELALQAIDVPTDLAQSLLPPAWYAFFARLCGDLSTISTLVPVLLLLFPVWMGSRILWLSRIDSTYVHRLVYDPYPPHFPFFLVMLGLTGTLYGLLIGLSASGVAEMGSSTPSSDAIQHTIDRLMGGTATALLSSLVGLVGAFLAARPLTWMFRHVAGIPEEEAQRNLVDVVSALTRDLQALSHASREFGERLNVAAADRLHQQLSQIDGSLTRLTQGLGETNERFEKLLGLQEQNARHMTALAHLSELQRLARMEEAVAASTQSVAQLGEAVDVVRAEQEQLRSAAERTVAELQRGQLETHADLQQIHAVLDENQRRSGADRNALRQALGDYLQIVPQHSE